MMIKDSLQIYVTKFLPKMTSDQIINIIRMMSI
jgi:hypothetical protein